MSRLPDCHSRTHYSRQSDVYVYTGPRGVSLSCSHCRVRGHSASSLARDTRLAHPPPPPPSCSSSLPEYGGSRATFPPGYLPRSLSGFRHPAHTRAPFDPAVCEEGKSRFPSCYVPRYTDWPDTLLASSLFRYSVPSSSRLARFRVLLRASRSPAASSFSLSFRMHPCAVARLSHHDDRPTNSRGRSPRPE